MKGKQKSVNSIKLKLTDNAKAIKNRFIHKNKGRKFHCYKRIMSSYLLINEKSLEGH